MIIAKREWWEPPSSGMVLGSSASLPSCQFPDIFKLLVDLASLGGVEWCVRAAAAWICQLATSTCVHAPDKQIACTRLGQKPLTLILPSLPYRKNRCTKRCTTGFLAGNMEKLLTLLFV